MLSKHCMHVSSANMVGGQHLCVSVSPSCVVGKLLQLLWGCHGGLKSSNGSLHFPLILFCGVGGGCQKVYPLWSLVTCGEKRKHPKYCIGLQWGRVRGLWDVFSRSPHLFVHRLSCNHVMLPLGLSGLAVFAAPALWAVAFPK